jgi:hypothetical protein
MARKRLTLSGGWEQGRSLFATEQIACNQIFTKEEFDIHVVNHRYDIVSQETINFLKPPMEGY